MQTINCDTKIILCSYRQLDDMDKKLVDAAKKAATAAYAPYSDFMVGAAVMCDGEIITGNNQENASYPCGMCAERVALFAAASREPGIRIDAIAIAAHNGEGYVKEPVTPCGSCRQVLAEYEARQRCAIRIIMHGEEKEYIAPSASSLLPLAFSLPQEK